jgi:hypothetical protein
VHSAGVSVVHSAFVRAVNLTIRGDMWTVLAVDKADLPFGIRVALPKLDTIGLRKGDEVSVRAGFVRVGSRLVIDCRMAPRWTPVFEKKLKPDLERRLAVVSMAARDRSWHDSARMAHAVRSAMNDATALNHVLTQVVGRGPGATPSGDDVLVGALAVLISPHAGMAGLNAAELLGRSLLPLLPTTTDVSGHLLRQAASGLFCRDVHELVSALIGAASSRELSEIVRRIVDTGATSGADICEGLLAFAPAFFSTHNGRVAV